MNKVNRCRDVLAALFAVALLAGCGSDRANTQAGGTAFGAALGCGLGVLIGGNAQSCAIGAAAGGVTGYVAGTAVANKKEEYAQREDTLDSQTASAQQMNSALLDRNAQLRTDLAAREKRLAALEQGVSSSTTTKKQLSQERDQVRRRINDLQPVVSSAGEELAQQQGLLREAQAKGASPDDVAEYKAQVAAMERNVAELNQLVQQYAEVDDRISRSL